MIAQAVGLFFWIAEEEEETQRIAWHVATPPRRPPDTPFSPTMKQKYDIRSRTRTHPF